MKVKITVSLCISNDYEIVVDNPSPENLYEAFMNQEGLPSEIYDGKWVIDDLVIIPNETN